MGSEAMKHPRLMTVMTMPTSLMAKPRDSWAHAVRAKFVMATPNVDRARYIRKSHTCLLDKSSSSISQSKPALVATLAIKDCRLFSFFFFSSADSSMIKGVCPVEDYNS
jgi:hypothetical protein